jgi:hypothetical protein
MVVSCMDVRITDTARSKERLIIAREAGNSGVSGATLVRLHAPLKWNEQELLGQIRFCNGMAIEFCTDY